MATTKEKTDDKEVDSSGMKQGAKVKLYRRYNDYLASYGLRAPTDVIQLRKEREEFRQTGSVSRAKKRGR